MEYNLGCSNKILIFARFSSLWNTKKIKKLKFHFHNPSYIPSYRTQWVRAKMIILMTSESQYSLKNIYLATKIKKKFNVGNLVWKWGKCSLFWGKSWLSKLTFLPQFFSKAKDMVCPFLTFLIFLGTFT